MNILLVINEQKDPEYLIASEIVKSIGARAKVILEEGGRKSGITSVSYMHEKEAYDNADMILVLGGDGTMLSVAEKAASRKTPVIGVNLGRLGFLADIERHELEEGLNKLFAGEYIIEERMMLEAYLVDGTHATAINDLVITRANSFLKILELDVYIDDEYVDDFKADGIIIATPTGSTAYSLSAGGPIVDPSLNMMIVTPICPHKMYCRTIIAPPEKVITIKCRATSGNNALVAADSKILGEMGTDEILTIRVAPVTFRLIRLKGSQFFGALRRKLIKKES